MTRYNISPEQIDVFVNGALDPDVLHNLFGRISEDENFHCALKQFWHLQEVDCSNLETSSVTALGHALEDEPDQPFPPVAFIAQSDLVYGMCRVYAAWVGGKPIDVGVFRTYEDALAWAYPSQGAA